MQLAAIIVSLVLAVVGVALLARAIGQFVRYFKLGQPVPAGLRTDNPYQRSVTLTKEFLGHTRMNRWGIVGCAHWFVAVGFLTLPPTLAQAFGQLFSADWTLPVIGGFLNSDLLHLGPLALLYGVTMYLSTAMNPQQADPVQQKIFQFMPIMFTFIMAPFAVGLLIYWTWSNVLTVMQQYVIMRRFKVDHPIDQIIAKLSGKPKAVG